LPKFVALQDTLSTRPYDRVKLKKALEKVPSHETVTKALEIHDADEIKDYMEKHLNEVEPSLELVKRFDSIRK
jgi:DNA-binding GntR family transcriptional regulator